MRGFALAPTRTLLSVLEEETDSQMSSRAIMAQQEATNKNEDEFSNMMGIDNVS